MVGSIREALGGSTSDENSDILARTASLSLSPTTTTAIPRAPDTALCSSPHTPRPCCSGGVAPLSSHYLRHADQMPRQTKSPPGKSEATQASVSMTRQTEFGKAKVDESHSFSLRRDEVPRVFLTRTGSRTIVLFACFVFFAFS